MLHLPLHHDLMQLARRRPGCTVVGAILSGGLTSRGCAAGQLAAAALAGGGARRPLPDHERELNAGRGSESGSSGCSLAAKRLAEASAYPTVPLAELLDGFGAPRVIDYLSLDVEGHEEAVLREFPFDRCDATTPPPPPQTAANRRKPPPPQTTPTSTPPHTPPHPHSHLVRAYYTLSIPYPPPAARPPQVHIPIADGGASQLGAAADAACAWLPARPIE